MDSSGCVVADPGNGAGFEAPDAFADRLDRELAEGSWHTIREPQWGAMQWVWHAVMAAGGGVGLSGSLWPEADEGLLLQLAWWWGELGTLAGQAQSDLADGGQVVAELYRGTAGMQFRFTSFELQIDPLDTAGAAASYQMYLNSAAVNFAQAKLSMIIQGIVTMMYVIIATIRAMFTFGATSPEIAAAVATGQLAVRTVAQRLLLALGNASVRGVWGSARQLAARVGGQSARAAAGQAARRAAARGAGQSVRQVIRTQGYRAVPGHVGRWVAPRLAREMAWEAFEEAVLIQTTASAWGSRYGYGRMDWNQFVLSGAGGALGGPMSSVLPRRGVLDRVQRGLAGSNPVRRGVVNTVVGGVRSGMRIGTTSTLSSYAAFQGLAYATPLFDPGDGPGVLGVGAGRSSDRVPDGGGHRRRTGARHVAGGGAGAGAGRSADRVRRRAAGLVGRLRPGGPPAPGAGRAGHRWAARRGSSGPGGRRGGGAGRRVA